ncbi:MAG: inorganic phosphate transporter [Pseudanabaena sp. ELA607]|jgi:PiT family inorganic phosphate transporter
MGIALLWLIGGLALYFAMMLGANDLANSMGTSVGSGALSWRKAILIAAIMELAGAVFFGHQVANTLANGLVTPLVLNQSPQVLLMGMVAVLLTCGVGLQWANHFGVPVASSHGIVGALLGFALVVAGTDGINWQKMVFIAGAWLITPVLAGVMAWLGMRFIYHWIDSQRLIEWLPWLVGVTLAVVGSSLLHAIGGHGNSHDNGTRWLLVLLWFGSSALATNYLIPKRHSTDIFSQLQIMSAATMAFAHGSNDVGNAIAPMFIAVKVFWQENYLTLSRDLETPTWLLLLGGIGIVLGLIFWGQRVLSTVGQDITLITPQTGFVAELAASTTVLMGSALGIPASSTHALVGAVIGIGLAQNAQLISNSDTMTTAITPQETNWQLVRQILSAWVLTIPVAVIGSGLIYRLLSIIKL